MDLLINTAPPEKQEKFKQAANAVPDMFLEMKSMSFNQRISFLLSKNLAAMKAKTTEQGGLGSGIRRNMTNLALRQMETVIGEREADIFKYTQDETASDANLVETLKMLKIVELTPEIKAMLSDNVAIECEGELKSYHKQHLLQHVSPLSLICSQKVLDLLVTYEQSVCTTSICDALMSWTGDAFSFRHVFMLLFSQFCYFCDEDPPEHEDWGSYKLETEQIIFCNQLPHRQLQPKFEQRNKIKSTIQDAILLLFCFASPELISEVKCVLVMTRNLLVNRLTVQSFLLDTTVRVIHALHGLLKAGRINGVEFEARYACLVSEQDAAWIVFMLEKVLPKSFVDTPEVVKQDLTQKIVEYLDTIANMPSVVQDVVLSQKLVLASMRAGEHIYCLYLWQLAQILVQNFANANQFFNSIYLLPDALTDLVICVAKLPESQMRNHVLTLFSELPEMMSPMALDAICRVIQVPNAAEQVYNLYEQDGDTGRIFQFDDTLCTVVQPRALEIYVEKNDKFAWFAEMFQNNLNASIFAELSERFMKQIIKQTEVSTRFKVKTGILRPEFLRAVFASSENFQGAMELFWEELFHLYSQLSREQLQVLSECFEPLAVQILLHMQGSPMMTAVLNILQLFCLNGVPLSRALHIIYLRYKTSDFSTGFPQLVVPIIEGAASFSRMNWEELAQFVSQQRREGRQQLRSITEGHGAFIAHLISQVSGLNVHDVSQAAGFLEALGATLPPLDAGGVSFLQRFAASAADPSQRELALRYLVAHYDVFQADPGAFDGLLNFPIGSLGAQLTAQLCREPAGSPLQRVALSVLTAKLTQDKFCSDQLLQAALRDVSPDAISSSFLGVHLLCLLFAHPCAWRLSQLVKDETGLLAAFTLAHCTDLQFWDAAQSAYDARRRGERPWLEILTIGLLVHQPGSPMQQKLCGIAAASFHEMRAHENAASYFKALQDSMPVAGSLSGLQNRLLPLLFQGQADSCITPRQLAGMPSPLYAVEVLRCLLNPETFRVFAPQLVQKSDMQTNKNGVLGQLELLLLQVSFHGPAINFSINKGVLKAESARTLRKILAEEFAKQSASNCLQFTLTRRSIFLEKIMCAANPAAFLSNLVLLLSLISLQYQELFQMVMEVLPPKAQLMSNQKLTNQKLDMNEAEMDTTALVMVGMLLHFKHSNQVEKDVSAVLIQKLAAIIIPPPEYVDFLPQHLMMRILSLNKLPQVQQFLEATNIIKALQTEYEEFMSGLEIGPQQHASLICQQEKLAELEQFPEPAESRLDFQRLQTQATLNAMLLDPRVIGELPAAHGCVYNQQSARVFLRAKQLYIITGQVQVYPVDNIVSVTLLKPLEAQIRTLGGTVFTLETEDEAVLLELIAQQKK